MSTAITRRRFLQRSGQAAAFVLALRASGGAEMLFQVESAERALFQPNAFLSIYPDNRIVFSVLRMEMGQGVRTSLTQVLADELSVEMSQLKLEQPIPGARYQGIRLRTSGSGSAAGTWTLLRTGAAAAREMLVAAAAARWKAPAGECRAEQGAVVHGVSGRRANYGELAQAAAQLPVPEKPTLKPLGELRVVGRRVLRVDGPEIVRGAATYGMDVRAPGMKYAVMARCPVLGGKVKSWDGSAARQVPGVLDVVPITRGISTGIAVVAESTWAALQGRDALQVEWEHGTHVKFNTAEFMASLHSALDGAGFDCRSEGDAASVLATAAKRMEATYSYPCEAHACLEPMNCTAHVRDGECEIWVPTQAPERTQEEAAKILGIDQEKVKVHVMLMGGGFGRRLYVDYVEECVELAQNVPYPVQLVWTREDDTRCGYFHPAAVQRITVAVGEQGRPAAWLHQCAGSDLSVTGPVPPAERTPTTYAESRMPWGAFDNFYRVPALKVEFMPVESPVPSGPWRAVYYPEAVFARECFIDELAHAAGADPIEYRIALLAPYDTIKAGPFPLDRARMRKVLEAAAERSDWKRPLGQRGGRRWGRGIACNIYHGMTHMAQVAEVSVGNGGDLRLERIVCVVDCGLVLNPLGMEAQVESAVLWGLSALKSEITFRNGRAEQSSFRDFPVLRIDEAPRVETYAVPSVERPYGLGEQPVAPAVPAVVNAIFAATGKRVRRLPLRAQDLG